MRSSTDYVTAFEEPTQEGRMLSQTMRGSRGLDDIDEERASLVRSESDPHLVTHIAQLLLVHAKDEEEAQHRIAMHLASSLCLAAANGNVAVAKRCLMLGAMLDAKGIDDRCVQPPARWCCCAHGTLIVPMAL